MTSPNVYNAYYSGKTITIQADTSYNAQQKAISIFKPPKSKRHMVSVVIVENKDGPVMHSTGSI